MELDDAPRYTRDAWTHDNNLGLQWASEGRWFEAADAFARAVALSAMDFHDDFTPFAREDVEQEDAHAVLLCNLSQAQFQIGHLEEALHSAERACEIRISLMGDDAAPVARSRNQMAVTLGSMGRLDEAQALIGAAIAALEAKVSDDDLALAPLLENAARFAVASGQPAAAEPHLLRLHALLSENDQPVAPVEWLLRHVADSRAGVAVAPAETQVAYVPVSLPGYNDGPLVMTVDDEPLREAVEATTELLRSTPSVSEEAYEFERAHEHEMELKLAIEDAVQYTSDVDAEPAADSYEVSTEITAEYPIATADEFSRDTAAESGHESVSVNDAFAFPIESADQNVAGNLDVLDLELEIDEAKLETGTIDGAIFDQRMIEEATHATSSRDPKSATDQTGKADDIFGGAAFDLVEPPPPTLSELPPKPAAVPKANPLGFEVEYGVPQQPYGPTDIEEQPAGRVSGLDMPTAVVLPNTNSDRDNSKSHSSQDNAALRVTLHPADVDEPRGGSRKSRRSNTGLRFGRTKAADPKRPWLIGAAVLLMGAAAAVLLGGVPLP